MGKILKITVQERIWNKASEAYDETTKEYDRESYDGDFNYLILENIKNWDIQDYAEHELDMIEEAECECDDNLYQYDNASIIAHLKEEGFEVIKCQTITESMRLEKLKEALEFC